MPPDLARAELLDHPLIVQALLLPRALVFHVKFQYWDPDAGIYKGVANAPVTLVWTDLDDVEHDITGWHTDSDGLLQDQTNAPPNLDSTTLLTPSLKGVHFVIGDATNPLLTIIGSPCNIDKWSTKGWLAADKSTKGFFYPNYELGKSYAPIEFHVGVKYDLQFQYWDRKRVKRNFPIGVQGQLKIKNQNTPPPLLFTIAKNAELKGVLFDILPSSDVDLELFFQTVEDTTQQLPALALTLTAFAKDGTDIAAATAHSLQDIEIASIGSWPKLTETSLSDGQSSSDEQLSIVLAEPKYAKIYAPGDFNYQFQSTDGFNSQFSSLIDPKRKAVMANYALSVLADYRILNLAFFYLLDFQTTTPTAWQGLPLLGLTVSGIPVSHEAATSPDDSNLNQNSLFKSNIVLVPSNIVTGFPAEFHEMTHALSFYYLLTRDDFYTTPQRHSPFTYSDKRTAYLEGFAEFGGMLFVGPELTFYSVENTGKPWWRPFSFQYAPSAPWTADAVTDVNRDPVAVSYLNNDGEKIEGAFALSLYLVFYRLVLGKTDMPPAGIWVAAESGDGDVMADPIKNYWLSDSTVQRNFKNLIWNPVAAAAGIVGAGTSDVVAKIKAAADNMTSAVYPQGIRHRVAELMNELAVGVEEIQVTTVGFVPVANNTTVSNLILGTLNTAFTNTITGDGFVEGMSVEFVSVANASLKFPSTVSVASHSSLTASVTITTAGNYTIELVTRWGRRIVGGPSGAAVTIQ